MSDLKSGQLLTEISSQWPRLGVLLKKHEQAITKTAANAAVSPTGKIPAPPRPDSVNVSTVGDYMQITVDHSAPIQKGVQYVAHISTNPQFSQPLVHDMGCSRSPVPFPLPSKDSTGAAIAYHVGVTAQYQGSDPSPITYHGGDAPAPIVLGGTSQMTLLPATGSGTGSSNGQSGPVGLGVVQLRPAPAAKRTV